MRRIYVFLTVILAACGGVSEPTPELVPLTYEPLRTPTFTGQCADIDPLEQWLQRVGLSYGEFDSFLIEAESLNEVLLYQGVERIGTVTTVISGVNVPDCAVDAHQQMFDAMQMTSATFQAHINMGEGTVARLVDEARIRFGPARETYDVLLAQLDELYAASVNTPPDDG